MRNPTDVRLPRTNLDDALELVHEIDKARSVIRELKSAFAKNELDGGVKAAPKRAKIAAENRRKDQRLREVAEQRREAEVQRYLNESAGQAEKVSE